MSKTGGGLPTTVLVLGNDPSIRIKYLTRRWVECATDFIANDCDGCSGGSGTVGVRLSCRLLLRQEATSDQPLCNNTRFFSCEKGHWRFDGSASNGVATLNRPAIGSGIIWGNRWESVCAHHLVASSILQFNITPRRDEAILCPCLLGIIGYGFSSVECAGTAAAAAPRRAPPTLTGSKLSSFIILECIYRPTK